MHVFSLQARRHLIPRQPLLTVAELLEKIVNDELFGLVQCDVRVPDHLKSYFAQFLPVFKNAMVSLEDVGPHMRALCEHYGVLNKPRRTLISSYYGEQVLLTTSQIQWYIGHGELLLKITPNTGRRCGSGVGIFGVVHPRRGRHPPEVDGSSPNFSLLKLRLCITGLIIDKVTSFFQFVKKQPFVQFAEDTISARRAADDGTGSEVKGTVQKLKGNSGYGMY